MRIVYEISVIKDRRSIAEPQYETAGYYAITGFATTIDEAAKKATRYMIGSDRTKGLNRTRPTCCARWPAISRSPKRSTRRTCW